MVETEIDTNSTTMPVIGTTSPAPQTGFSVKDPPSPAESNQMQLHIRDQDQVQINGQVQLLDANVETPVTKICLQLERNLYKSIISNVDKVKMLIRIHKDHDDHVTSLIGKDESWYQVNVRPVIHCVNGCYQGNVLNFCEQFNKYNKFTSKFRCIKCWCGGKRGGTKRKIPDNSTGSTTN